MKTIYIFAIAAITFLTSSCSKESEITLPTDVVWTSYISTQGSDIWDENLLYVEPGDYLLLRDVSQSALSHEWIIDDQVSLFTQVDDTSTTIADKSSTDLDAYIVFEKSGWTTIKMRNTFATEVKSNTSPLYDASINTYYDDEAGVWVFEKVWNVEIYGALKPGFNVARIESDGSQSEILSISGDDETSNNDLTEVTLSLGDDLKFIYDSDSEYKSTSQSWNIEGGTYDANEDTYSFDTAGTYSGFTVTATRDEVSLSANKITASSVTKVVPIKVIVEN